MAAVYLHNSLLSRIQTDPRDSLAHSRNFSSLSNAPLLTNTVFHTQPTEPLLLLSPDSAISDASYDAHLRQARHDERTPAHLRWDDSLAHDTLTAPVAEKRGSIDKRQRSQWRHRLTKILMELIMGAWSIYTTIRYFLALVTYGDPSAQTIFLALGTSSVVSSILIIFCLLLTTFGRNFLFGPHHLTLSFLLSLLRTISYLCLLGPAIVNFIFIFLWRYSGDPNLDLRRRCRLDVDAIWTVSSNICIDNAPSWTLWVAFASIRLVITITFIALYHTISILRPDSLRKRHHHRNSDLPSFTDNVTTFLAPMPSLRGRQPSDLTLDTTLVGESTPQKLSRVRLARSRSSGMSTEGPSTEPSSFRRSSALEVRETEHDETAFIDRFHRLITQINEEMDCALTLARSDSTHSSEITEDIAYNTQTATSHDRNHVEPIDDLIHRDSCNIFNRPPLPPSLGYNEFGLPYPPDENIRMLNGFIKRMPTIESMGSGEATTSLDSNHRLNGRGGNFTHSRPPTRNTLLTVSTNNHDTPQSNSSSRPNSFSHPMEISINMTPISATSEYGELLGRADRRLSTPSSADFLYGTASSTTHESSGSRSTAGSYHTAAMGGSYSPT